MDNIDAQEYRLGSPAASIVGIAQRLLDRDDLDEELTTYLSAIRDLALEMVREAEHAGSL
jgi:phosphate uptake regulator